MILRTQAEPILLQDRHVKLFDAYREHFVDGFEDRCYNTRTGHVRPSWSCVRGDCLGCWRRLKVRDRDIPLPHDLRSRNRLIEKHLGFENWNHHVAATGRGKSLGEPFFLGLYAGKTTRHVVFDIDCHGGRRLHYRRRGRLVPVSDLRLDTLRDLEKLYDLERRPDVLMTSSPSLGLYAYFQLRRPIEIKEAVDHHRHLARSVGLECEIYPSFTNCLRRPMGDGSFTLSTGGILREFADQMRHYLDPGPLPPYPAVVEMLLSLWTEQHDDLAADHDGDFIAGWEDLKIDPAAERKYMEDRVREIRSWLAGGDGRREGSSRTAPAPIVSARPDLAPDLARSRTGGQSWPEAWKEPHVHWRDRVWHLAKFGLPLPDTLNCALLDLAQWLLGVEFYDVADREEQVHRLLEGFCALRHNGQSDRLQGVEDVEGIPKEICREIHAVVENARDEIEKETFVRMRRRTYESPLRVAFLLTGEGEANLYRPAIESSFFSQHDENTPALPLSVAVSPAIVPDLYKKMNLEAIIQSGILDRPLPSPIEEKITRRGKALLFLRRLGNYLRIRGGVARIHHSKLARFAEVELADRKALSRYKAVGVRANLFFESDGYVVGDRSIEYSLTEEARDLIRLHEEARRDRVGANTPTDMPRPFSPEYPSTQDHRRKAL